MSLQIHMFNNTRYFIKRKSSKTEDEMENNK